VGCHNGIRQAVCTESSECQTTSRDVAPPFVIGVARTSCLKERFPETFLPSFGHGWLEVANAAAYANWTTMRSATSAYHAWRPGVSRKSGSGNG